MKDKANKLRLELDKSFLQSIGINVKDDELISLYQEIHSAFKQWIGE